MFKHILVLSINKDNTETIAESYFQVNLFGKQLKLFKRRTKLTVKPKEHKPTDDYINIRVPKRGDVPIISIDGNLAYSDTEGLESIKFVWATKDHRDTELFIPFVDVRILSHDNQNNVEYVRLATGNETAAEIQRETVNAKYRVKHIRTHDNDLPIRPEVSE
ncbi:MAG: hypothetical protein ACTH8E_11870 [Brochothrix thermosphacta]|uniref:hypothetical protein n=1 Tax=Brochothrix thermosphacta TaxID=2756 RepID=UPI003F9143CB